ncbi:MAG: exodeoxyribonuclease V subunit alpha, partial [Solirubrobacteraceae bacterium]
QAQAAGGPPPLVALAAPTGRAAARLEEALHHEAAVLDLAPQLRERLLELRAQTLHRLLGLRPGGGRWGSGRRLAHDLVVVDETSMVSLSLMAALTAALRPSARLVLVGDPDQLASIEAGSVLADIVGEAPGTRKRDAGERPGIVTLDRVHRFGGAIAALAAAIRAGDGDRVIEVLRRTGGELTWLETSASAADPPAAVVDLALAAAAETIAPAREGRAELALARLGAFRVLCAHRRGPYGAETWSSLIETRLAATGAGAEGANRWYPGRPLLVTENDPELRLANGDSGVVVSLADGRVACAFAHGGGTVLHSPSRLGAVQTVYASTIHRSQGAQFDATAVLLPEPGSRLLTRELLYTAVTRARRALVVAGEEESIRRAVARPAARASGLAARLWGAT